MTYLTGPQQAEFMAAMRDAYEPMSLQMLLLYRLDRTLHNYAIAQDFQQILFLLIGSANKGGWIVDLVAAAVAERPSPPLMAFAAKIQAPPAEAILPASARVSLALHGIINPTQPFADVTQFLTTLARLADRTCRIDVPGSGGTGLLIGPDLVLTNYHVIAPLLAGANAARAACVFDYKSLHGSAQVSPGIAVALAKSWQVAWRRYSDGDLAEPPTRPGPTEGDYAVMRLAERIGDAPVVGSSPRGFLPLRANAPDPPLGTSLLLLQHPKPGHVQLPMQLGLGKVLQSPWPALRMRHDVTTEHGSSGGPVFDANLELVALHHAGDPEQAPRYNQAIPIATIVADLKTRAAELQTAGVEAFWS